LKNLSFNDVLNVIRQASERELTTSGNAAYMRLELALARVTNEKIQLEGLKRSLEDEVIRLQSRLQTIECVTFFYYLSQLTGISNREINDKLTHTPHMNFPLAVGSGSQT